MNPIAVNHSNAFQAGGGLLHLDLVPECMRGGRIKVSRLQPSGKLSVAVRLLGDASEEIGLTVANGGAFLP